MRKIKGFSEFSQMYEANIFSRGMDIVKKAGSWLSNLINFQKENKIPVRGRKYNPETKQYEQIETPQAIIKIHLPEGYKASGVPTLYNPVKESSGDPAWKTAQKTQDPEIEDIEAPQLVEEISYHFQNPVSGRPLLIWGAPGIGKTTIVKDYALQELKVPVIEVILSLMEPTDVAGLPGVEADLKYQDTKRSVNFLPMIWPLDNGPEGKGGVIFLDEINRAHPSVQAAMLKVVLDREISGANYKIPDKWLILAAANRPEDEPGGMIRPISFALANRFAQVNLMGDPDSWVNWARKKPALSDDVVSFVELMQDYFYMMPGNLAPAGAETTMGVTPRAWDYAAREFKDRSEAAKAKGSELGRDDIYRIFAKHVGKKVSSVITDFLETTKVWPVSRIALIYTNPNDPQTELPMKSGGSYDFQKSYGAMYMVSKYKQGSTLTKEEFSNFITYLTSLGSGEIAMSALNMSKRIHPEVKNYLGDTSLEKVVTPFVTKYKSFMKEI